LGPLARRRWRAPDCWLSPGPSPLVPQLPSRDVGPYSRGPVRPASWLSFSGSFAWALLEPARVDLTTPDQPVAPPVRPLQQAAVPRLCQRPCGRLRGGRQRVRPRSFNGERQKVRLRSLNGGRQNRCWHGRLRRLRLHDGDAVNLANGCRFMGNGRGL